MATIINTPASGSESSGNGMGFFLGMLVLLLIVVLFFVYGLPALRAVGQTAAPQGGGTTINVPEEIDVNVNNPQGQ